MKRLILISFTLLIGLFAPVPGTAIKEVHAQASNCSDYDFPSGSAGWTVITGEANFDTRNVFHNGTGTIVIDVTLELDVPVYVTSIRWETYATPQTGIRHERIFLYDPRYPDILPQNASQYGNVDLYPGLDLPFWRANTVFFNAVPTNKIEFIMVQDPVSFLTALRVLSICITGEQIITMTPSPTISPTPSITPTPPPTWSPTPSNTPEFTNTPAPTQTDGPATSTGESPVTATGIGNNHTGNFVFNTVQPPDQCSSVTNPCGAMPFPVPGFAPVNISSPTALASSTSAATLTLYPTMTAYGTPGGTPGTGTPTLTAGPGDAIAAYATGINEQLGNVQMTPGLIDPNGSLIDLRNGANELGLGIGSFFGILKALQSFFLGKTGNIIAILILIAGFVITVKLILWMIPVIRAIATFIVGFIP